AEVKHRPAIMNTTLIALIYGRRPHIEYDANHSAQVPRGSRSLDSHGGCGERSWRYRRYRKGSGSHPLFGRCRGGSAVTPHGHGVEGSNPQWWCCGWGWAEARLSGLHLLCEPEAGCCAYPQHYISPADRSQGVLDGDLNLPVVVWHQRSHGWRCVHHPPSELRVKR